MHVSQLGDIVEDAQTVSDQKFSELEKKFEVIGVIHVHLYIT